MDLDDEHSIVNRAKKDPEAFGILFEKYYHPIFGYVLRRTEDWNVSNDITSEVFLKAFKSLWRYRWQGISFASWLYRIATNELRMYFRKGRRHIMSLDQLMQDTGFEPVDPQTLQEEKAEAERKLRQYDEFLAIRSRMIELPTKYQDVLSLRYFERKSVKEIGEILNMKEGTVKSLLSRGVAKLKNFL